MNVQTVHFDNNGPSNLTEMVPVIGMKGTMSCAHLLLHTRKLDARDT